MINFIYTKSQILYNKYTILSLVELGYLWHDHATSWHNSGILGSDDPMTHGCCDHTFTITSTPPPTYIAPSNIITYHNYSRLLAYSTIYILRTCGLEF